MFVAVNNFIKKRFTTKSINSRWFCIHYFV